MPTDLMSDDPFFILQRFLDLARSADIDWDTRKQLDELAHGIGSIQPAGIIQAATMPNRQPELLIAPPRKLRQIRLEDEE